jgi:4-hydroxy-4-methyl-2-oxoglutarate aldolase
MNRFQTLDASIKSLHIGRRMAGPAFTVQAMPSCNWGAHQALALAKRGDVLVIDAQGSSRNAVWGYVMTVAAKNIGLAGVVIDGCIRDAMENRGDTLPIFCKGICSGGPHKGWPENINVAISCGGVAILPGDIIVGDDDGVVAVPVDKVNEVLDEAVKRMKIEQDWYERLKKGETTLELLGMRPI